MFSAEIRTSVRIGSAFLAPSTSLTFIPFWHIAVHISVSKSLLSRAGKRWVRAVPSGAAEESWCLHGWLCRLSFAWPELGRCQGMGQWPTHTSEEGKVKLSGYEFRQEKKEVCPWKCPMTCLIRGCVDQRKASPSAQRRCPEENSVSWPVCNRCWK